MDKKPSKKTIIIIAIALAAVIAAVIIIVSGKSGGANGGGDTGTVVDGGSVSIDETAQDIEVISMENITAAYVEDGSDEVLSDVMALTIRNTGDKMLQLAEITVHSDAADYTFKATTIPAGGEARLMELNRAVMPGNIGECSLSISQLAWDEQGLGMCEDSISIVPRSNGFVVKNLTGNTIEAGHINFYYKNVDGGVYIGGITYHAANNAAIAPGEELAVATAHFDAASSEIMFVIIN